MSGGLKGRRICKIEGCINPAMQKELGDDGQKRYRTVCSKHWRRKHAKMTKDGVCELCGWTGQVHNHRVLPGQFGGRYVEGNVLRLCPNGHAHAHGRGESCARKKEVA